MWLFLPRDSALSRFLLLLFLSGKHQSLSHIHLSHVPKISRQPFSFIPPRMAPSNTGSSSGQHPNPSLGDLHRHVMDVAANLVGRPAIPSAFIGPARPTSTYLGEVTIVADPGSEIAVPIIFRCVHPLGAQSRHVLVRMKPSMSELDLALRLCQMLDIPTTGCLTIEPVFKWMAGLMPYAEGMDKGKHTSKIPLKTVARAN